MTSKQAKYHQKTRKRGPQHAYCSLSGEAMTQYTSRTTTQACVVAAKQVCRPPTTLQTHYEAQNDIKTRVGFHVIWWEPAMVVRPTTNGGMDLSVGTRRGCMAHNNW